MKKKLQSDVYLDPQTGEEVRSYFYDDKPCQRLVINDKLQLAQGEQDKLKKLTGYSLILADLESVLFWLEELKKGMSKAVGRKGDHFQSTNDHAKVVRSFFVSSLAFYAKCFNKASGREIKLQNNWVDTKFKETHEFLINHRNNFAAHAGTGAIERAGVACISYEDEEKKFTTVVAELYLPSGKWDDEDKFIHLVKHLYEKVDIKINELVKDLAGGKAFIAKVKSSGGF